MGADSSSADRPFYGPCGTAEAVPFPRNALRMRNALRAGNIASNVSTNDFGS
jgi:hypothetical protein